MSDSPWVNGLACVAELRRCPPFKQIRERVLAGEPFIICNFDEIEEICNVMDIPVVAINPWNLEIMLHGSDQLASDALEQAGYPGPHLGNLGYPQYFGLGFGASLDPNAAPHGGLPRPTAIVSGGKSEAELRVCELWAREVGCPVFPLDFMFSVPFETMPWNGFSAIKRDWDKLLDPHRVALRVEQEKGFIAFLERETGRTFSVDTLIEYMEQINYQMDLWHQAQDLIARTRPSPVSQQDLIEVYAAAIPRRGTPQGVALTKVFLEEVRDRVERKIAAHPNEKIRLYYEGFFPPWQEEIARRYGAVTVASAFTGVAEQYARDIKNGDPFPALASRHMFLFDSGPERLLDAVRWCQCDGVIVPEVNRTPGNPSVEQLAIESAGIPYLAVPRDVADDEVKAMVSAFIEQRLQ